MSVVPLDTSYVNRAAPPGSLRYFSLLYTPPGKRPVLTALYVLDTEIRDAARSSSHDVGHARLQWWQEEMDRLAQGDPQHPATRILAQTAASGAGSSGLRELLAAADMDLAHLTYATAEELHAYCARSSGGICEIIAAQLCAPASLDEASRSFAQQAGIGIRMTEMLRDVRQDAWDGRVYLPLDLLERHDVHYERLRSRDLDPAVRIVLETFAADAREALQGASTAAAELPAERADALRAVRVLAALHERLLDRIAARGYDVVSQRIELGPIEKPWLAWRAARRR
ncbi:phytoene synthase [Steroidobacter denitrificans]|uniref:Phytoene synthase n=1 Tax=Steroidobacter denitrificans TaxID=465721 RepID=A0A127FB83_STEDE|nr:squalene/phytoene synthase family protein [Steroidobacter denitrificans]AMN46860.1 phytoene synthase [Steroidobacter denitrificans]